MPSRGIHSLNTPSILWSGVCWWKADILHWQDFGRCVGWGIEVQSEGKPQAFWLTFFSVCNLSYLSWSVPRATPFFRVVLMVGLIQQCCSCCRCSLWLRMGTDVAHGWGCSKWEHERLSWMLSPFCRQRVSVLVSVVSPFSVSTSSKVTELTEIKELCFFCTNTYRQPFGNWSVITET